MTENQSIATQSLKGEDAFHSVAIVLTLFCCPPFPQICLSANAKTYDNVGF